MHFLKPFPNWNRLRKIKAAGYTPFSTGFAEWWVFKHVFQHFLDAAQLMM